MGNLLSVVVPCHNEAEVLPLFFTSIEQVVLPIDREYIFIDDGSTDGTLKYIKELHNKIGDRVRYLSFSRNFGKEAGIYAGLQAAKGDYVVLMDADMQDPPALLPRMYETLLSDNTIDSVGTRRVSRSGEPWLRTLFAKSFYWLINKISDTEIVDGARDYRMMTRQMVDSILSVSEYNRFSKGIFSWVGYRTHYIEYQNTERAGGKTSWSFWSLVAYAVDGIVSYSTIPLLMVSLLGVGMFVFSVLLAAIFAIRTLLFDNPVVGWTSLTVMLLGLGGIQLFSLGVLGQYLGKTFLEVKQRPLFIVKESEQSESKGGCE